MPPSVAKTMILLAKDEKEGEKSEADGMELRQRLDVNNNNNHSDLKDQPQSNGTKQLGDAPKINDINYLTAIRLNQSTHNDHDDATLVLQADTHTQWQPQIRWPDFLVQLFLHTGAIYGLYLIWFVQWTSLAWFFLLIWGSGFGITAGAHRLWSHKSYTAKWPLRLILVFLFTISGQRDAYTWAHDHRIHHKYSETNADPHNVNRGFFFAHIGWVFLTPHPDVVAKRKTIDMRDLEADPIVMFQKKHYEILFALIAIAMPVLVPWYFWHEPLWLSFWTMFNLRFCTTLNIAYFVNSAAHMWGQKPYDKKITSVENLAVAITAMGEGWHNYHHVFPWDYKTGELGSYMFNVTTGFIDFFARLGWAIDRKYVSPAMIARRAARCGDGTHYLSDEQAHKDPVWGYGDADVPEVDQRELQTMVD